MKDRLADMKNELRARDLISQDLLAWGTRTVASMFAQGMAFFGIKDGKLMVLPFLDLDTVLFKDAKYYTKESIKDIRFSGLASLLQITTNDGTVAKYRIEKGKPDMKLIVSAFSD